jgi:hypothetical protein
MANVQKHNICVGLMKEVTMAKSKRYPSICLQQQKEATEIPIKTCVPDSNRAPPRYKDLLVIKSRGM